MAIVMLRCFLLSITAIVFANSAMADKADVIDVKVERVETGEYEFHVTIDHWDDGWDHYANSWQVLAPNGDVLGTRELAHPHVEEMPFTRAKVITVPADVTEVTVQAGDLVHGFGGKTMTVKLPAN